MSRATPEIHNYVQVIFRPIIRADRRYPERQYTILITFCEIFSMPSTSEIDALEQNFCQYH